MNDTAEVLTLLPRQDGHFAFESGFHSAMWIDLERLCLQPRRVEGLAAELASRLSKYKVEAVCGPLVEGAFVGLMAASRLGVLFSYSERIRKSPGGLYPYDYRLPDVLRSEVRGKRVAIVNDVISAGSAVGGTFTDLQRCEARPVVVAALAVFGDWTSHFVAQKQLALETLLSLPNPIWTPADCPLCERGIPLTTA